MRLRSRSLVSTISDRESGTNQQSEAKESFRENEMKTRAAIVSNYAPAPDTLGTPASVPVML